MAKKERITVGQGAQAFFDPPVNQQDTGEVNQDTIKPVEKETTTPVSQDISTEPEQQTSVVVKSLTSRESGQDTTLPVETYDNGEILNTSKEVSQDTSSEPKKQRGGPVKKQNTGEVSQEGGYIKVSYYILPEQDLKLDYIRLKRKRKGIKVDKSALIREAIDALPD